MRLFIKCVLLVVLSGLIVACGPSTNSDNQNESQAYATINVHLPAAKEHTKLRVLKSIRKINKSQIPDEIDAIIIEVLNRDDEVLASGDILESGGELSLQIIAGSNYIVQGRALAGSELLFLGSSLVEAIAAGEKASVALSLLEQVELSLDNLSDQNVGGGEVSLESTLEGLSESSVEWSVNGVVGGNSTYGTITSSGVYTPPSNLPAVTEVTITVSPVAAPSFAQSIVFNLIPPGNLAPNADAGPDQVVEIGGTVVLDGSNSSDPEGSEMTYAWSLVSGDFTPNFSDENALRPSFVVPSLPLGGSATLQLSVRDDQGARDSDMVVVTVNPPNIAPVANAGGEQTVLAGVSVSLNGTGSTDNDGSIVSYQWAFVSGDANPTLSDANSVTAIFTAPDLQYGGSSTYRLTVTDDDGATATDDVLINFSASDQALVADAGSNQTVNEGVIVNLDASASADPDNTISSYSWLQNLGATVTLTGANTATPSFTAPDVSADEDLVFEVTVTNDAGLSDTDMVTIRVNDVLALANPVYFAATSDGSALRLWTSDGTAAGTHQLNSVVVSNSDFNIALEVGDYMYFRGNDGINGTELWRSDGTVAGTEMIPVADVGEYSSGASASADPGNFALVGDRLVIGANTSQVGGISYPEYVSVDGTLSSISPTDFSVVHDTRPSAGYQRHNNALATYKGYVYFMDADYSPPATYSLYRTDGTNTAELVQSNLAASSARDFVEHGGDLYFVSGQNDLWKTDGSTTSLFKTFSGRVGYGLDADNPLMPFTVGALSEGGRLYFVADDGDGRELWSTNGVSPNAPDTEQILDLDGNSATSSLPFAFRSVNGNVLFMSQNGDSSTDGLWVTDGTAGGTTRLAAISVAENVGFYEGSTASEPIVIDVAGTEKLFFIGNDGTNGAELWVSDGTVVGTFMVTELRTGSQGSQPGVMRDGGGFLIFSAQDDDDRAKLWRSDGTKSGTTLIEDICPTDCFDNSAFFNFFS